MVGAKKSADIGMKRGRMLANLPNSKQLDVIAEGLPILMKSAGDLLTASNALSNYPRDATILNGHALEEIAKILILMDIVRCPSKIRSGRIGPMMGWFYDHLARLLYIGAQGWKPQDVQMLQSYVDEERKSHFVEGGFGEYILPNWSIWARESVLYADIATHESGEPTWSDPLEATPPWIDSIPFQWKLCQAMEACGVFTRQGLDIVSSIWSAVDFKDTEHWGEAERLIGQMLFNLEQAGLVKKPGLESSSVLYRLWQLPMYRIDFKQLDVPLADLRAEQDATFWGQVY